MTDQKQQRAQRMAHLIADHFHLAQVVGLGRMVEDGRMTQDQHSDMIWRAIDELMETATKFYATPDEAMTDIAAFFDQLGVTYNMGLVVNGKTTIAEVTN